MVNTNFNSIEELRSYFAAIPQENWLQGGLHNLRGQHCAFGHVMHDMGFAICTHEVSHIVGEAIEKPLRSYPLLGIHLQAYTDNEFREKFPHALEIVAANDKKGSDPKFNVLTYLDSLVEAQRAKEKAVYEDMFA